MKKISPVQRVLNLWAIILIVWSVYRTKLSLPEWLDEFVAKPLVFVLPVYLYIKKFEKGGFFASIWLTKKKFFEDIYIGLLIGGLFAFSALLSNFVKHDTFSFASTIFTTDAHRLIWLFLLALATGITEEILSRGFILKRLFEDSGNMYTASLNASILFFILHIPILFTNIKLTGGLLLLFMTTDLLLSFANSFIFLTRKSLLLPILVHAFYNLAIILYI